MKEMIITVGMILLACVLFGMIAGDHDSLRIAAKHVLEQAIRQYEGMGV